MNQPTVASTFKSSQKQTLNPKACKRTSAFTSHFAKGIFAIAQNKNKFVLRG